MVQVEVKVMDQEAVRVMVQEGAKAMDREVEIRMVLAEVKIH